MQININELIDRTGVHFGTSGARGLVAAMTDEVCYAYAAAFVSSLKAMPGTVLLGHDLRPSSPRMAAACAQACRDAGVRRGTADTGAGLCRYTAWLAGGGSDWNPYSAIDVKQVIAIYE